MQVVTIYSAFQGEVNDYGIGARCTFLRLAGCNLRCYKSTGCCDTPEGLSMEHKEENEMSMYQIHEALLAKRNDIICLTGGEPLLQDVEGLVKYIWEKTPHFKISIETNGTLPLIEFDPKYNVSYVVDYKLKSTEVTEPFHPQILGVLNKTKGYLKFVVDTEEDLKEFIELYHSQLRFHPYVKIALGLKWGSRLTYKRLTETLSQISFREVYLNIQAHKLQCLYDHTKEDLTKIIIPLEM